MKIEIEKLYGIRNKIEIDITGRRAIIFAPNGVGKTSIAKGFTAGREKYFEPSLEGDVSEDSIKLDGINLTKFYKDIIVINEEWLNAIILQNDDIIRGLLETREPKSGFLPDNLYGDYLDIYKDCVSALEEYGLHYDPIVFDSKNIRPISEIKKIINDKSIEIKNITSSVDVVGEIDKLTDAISVIEKTQTSSNKIDDFKDLLKKINEISKREFSLGVEEDFQIIELIKDKNRADSFRYVDPNGEVLTIEEAFKLIEEKLLNNGISKEHLETIASYNFLCKTLGKNPLKTAKSHIEETKKLINYKKNVALKFELIKAKDLFDKAELEVIKREEEFVREYNKEVDELNREILMINHLKWKIKINHIKNYYDVATVSAQNGDEDCEAQSLQQFASSGQKKILALILAIVHADKNGIIVFDDPISSLDEDNVGIFVQKVNSIKNEFIILTHNYRLLSSAAFISGIESFVLEADDKNHAFISKVDASSALRIPNWFNEKASNTQNAVLFFATVVREVIDNYLKSGYVNSGDNSKIIDELQKLKEILENNCRHFKTTAKTFKQSLEEINSTISPEVRDLLTDKNNGMRVLFDFTSDDIISEYVLNFEPKYEFLSLLDYASSKYVHALSIRFKFEREVLFIETSDREAQEKKWNNAKILGIHQHPSYKKMNPQKIAIFNSMQFLNHVNNLRWTPVIETPIYKIKMYSEELKK